MEQELKLALDAAAFKALQTHPLLKGRLKAPQQLDAIYYDTNDFLLARHQVGLRLRQQGKKSVQTLKARGNVSAGLHQRLEWEMPVRGSTLELDILAQAVAQDAELSKLLDKAHDKLLPCFEVKMERRIAEIEFQHSLVEVALDEGEILADGQLAVVRELELELKRGDTQALFGLAQELAKDVLLLPEAASKAERGYALRGFQAGQSKTPELRDCARLHQVLEEVLAHCIQSLSSASRAFVAEEEAGDALHQLRVATRRLRSALKSFEDKSPPPAFVTEDLKQLATALGVARDWEVLDRQTMPGLGPRLRREMDTDRLDGLLQALREAATSARLQARAAAAHPRVGSMLLGLQSWMLGLAGNPDLQLPADQGVKSLLKGLRRKMNKRGRKLRRAEARQLHRLRIAGKRSRYAHELFADLLPKRNKNYVGKLVEMQDVLGRMNDLTVARSFVSHVTGSQTEAARQFVCGYLCALTTSPAKKRPLMKSVKAVFNMPVPKPTA